MEEQNVSSYIFVCQHNQRGYCKNGSHCHKQHNNNICQRKVCRSSTCMDRHPRTCKYFANSGFCRFKDQCAYAHPGEKDKAKINILERDIAILKDEVGKMSKINSDLIERLKIIEIQLEFSREYTSTDKSHPHSKESEKQTDTTEQEDNIFKCYLCDFKSASKKTLRKHLNTRHPNTKIDIEDKVDDSESRLECSHCHQKFLTKKNWSEHVEEHMKEIENDNNFEQFIKECQKDLLDDSEDDYSASESED